MASPSHLRMSSREEFETVWFKSWDAKIPPPFNSFKGKIVPRLFLRGVYRRKIAIEVHRVPVPTGPKESAPSYYEQCILRILVPAAASGGAAATAGDADDSETAGPAEDEESTLMSPEFLDMAEGSVDAADRYDRQRWRAKYKFPIRAISITNTHKNSVTVHVTLGAVRQHREIIFGTVNDARDFAQVIQAQLDKEPDRVARKLRVTAKDVPLQSGEPITLLVEICSARGLLIGDTTASDPYVQVLFDGKEVHRTDYVAKSLDPIWTVKTNCLFLWTIDVKDLFVSDGLMCAMYDFNQVGHHTDLGHALIPPSVLYEASEERVELPLNPPAWWNGGAEATGFLAVRCRRASAYDVNFMKELAETRKKEKREEATPELQKIKNITKLATESAGGSGNVASMLTRRSKVVKTDEHPGGVKMYKVRPGPDPKRPKETKWMSQEEIHKETFKDSKEWIDSGSGHLGFLFVEILACDELPNLDTGGIIGNKTDAFVAVVFEDSFVTTDVIDDCLAPRWMPWSKRAFMFRIMHSSSQLFLGVFDYDVSFNPVDGHDLVGRASVDISNLRKDTVYILKYNLYTTSRMSQRKKKGTITLRIRLDVEDDRKFLLASLEPPPRIRVNTKNWKDYHVVQSTCTGKIDVDKYSMQTINSYIEELLALQQTVFYFKDAAASLMLWRGTAPIQISGRTFMIPIHSITAFTLLALLVEYPNLLPSCTMFGIAWFLLAVMQYRRHLPDVWSRCKSFQELLECLVFGESRTAPESIEPFANSEAASAFMMEWQKRIIDAEKVASTAYENASVDLDKEEQMMWQTDSSTSKGGGVNLDPIRPILFPVQQNLALLCKFIRRIKCIVFWEECYITFWIVSACLLLGTAFLFVPWFFIIQWSARILVWTLFGPWMKLVDIFYIGRDGKTSTQDSLVWMESEKRKRHEAARSKARISVEEEQKLRAMKEYMFGRFVTRVPVLKEDRYRDMPLPDSSATPYKANLLPLSELAMQEAGYKRKRLIGQQIVGHMIPRIETQGLTDAPVGRATAKPRLVDRREPGGKLTIGPSTVGAYTQIGLLAFAAGVLTWLGVPTISYLTLLLLKRT